MMIAEAWPEITENILASRRVRLPEYREESLSFTGGGRDEVVKIEKLLGRRLPKEFACYVAKLAPLENEPFEQINMPFSPYFELYSSKNLSMDIFPEWRESLKLELAEPFIVGDDGSCIVVINLEHPSCPAYLSGEYGTDLLAHSFADFLRILSYRDLILNTVDEGTDDDNYDEAIENPRWAEAARQIEKRVLEIAPECLEMWSI